MNDLKQRITALENLVLAQSQENTRLRVELADLLTSLDYLQKDRDYYLGENDRLSLLLGGLSKKYNDAKAENARQAAEIDRLEAELDNSLTR